MGQTAGNHTFCKQQVSLGWWKAGTSRMTGNHTFGVCGLSWVSWRQTKKGRKRQEFLVAKYNLYVHYALIIIKLALQIKSSHHAPMPWHFRSRSNKTKILPPLRQVELGWKSVKTNPKTLPPEWIVHFFISVLHITSLPEKHGSHSAEPACSPLERWACTLSHVWLSATLWTASCQAPLSMGFSRQEY